MTNTRVADPPAGLGLPTNYLPPHEASEHAPAAPRFRAGIHISALDGLRGLAVVMVMLFHTGLTYHRRTVVDSMMGHLLDLGVHGVDVFFVLSGFLITGILVDAKGSRGYFRNFYVRRSLRIFPLYYFVLVVLFIVIPLVWHPSSSAYHRLEANQAWYWSYLVNVLIATHGDAAAPINTAHFWSLAVEEQFYLVWPLVASILSRAKLKAACVWLLLVSLSIRCLVMASGLRFSVEIVHHVTPARIDGLVVGALVAIICREQGGIDRLRTWIRPLVLGSLTAVIAVIVLDHVLFPNTHALNFTLGFTVKAVFFASILIAALVAQPNASVRRFFESRVMRTFGRYSYGLYVYHYILILVLVTFVFPRVTPIVGDSGIMPTAALAFATFVSSGLVAWLSFTFLEKPILGLKRHFEMPG
jgi:peptidoglycan/LPS O-acetylase OafA/YrhL